MDATSHEGDIKMTSLHTDDALLRKLKAAASRSLSAEELRNQRISFIMGTLKDSSPVTRAKVTEVLAEREGKKTAA